jgi:hypothetical protein
LNSLEHTALIEETNGAEPLLSVRSDTRVDTGRWWRRSRLWICVTKNDVVVLAAARRIYIQRFAIADCQGSHYCHTTGQLVIEAGEELRHSRLAMSPVDALDVLNAIDRMNTENSQS